MRYRKYLSEIVSMNASNQWVANFDMPSQRGWMLGVALSRHSSGQPHKVPYPKTASRGGWALSRVSPSCLTRQYKPLVLAAASESRVVNHQWLSAHQVDTLAENGLDWISFLPSDWPLELFNKSMLGVENFQEQWHLSSKSVETLIQMTQEAQYYSMTFDDNTYWSYTCCLQLGELGRVRFIVYFRDSARRGRYAALITNRLDWSPSKVISQCFPCCSWEIFEKRSAINKN
jgi:hypothetical protein